MYVKWRFQIRMEKGEHSANSQEKRQCIENYRPGKILERLIFTKMFPLFVKNGLISQNQSGAKPGDSCVNQLLSITHEIYKSFDDGFDVRSVFLDTVELM